MRAVAQSTKWAEEQLLRAERYLGRKLLSTPFLEGDRRMFFVFGHMRTGSSLLVHILTTHPSIVGYGETHNVYTGPEDFGATTANVYRHLRTVPWKGRYVLDKVLHKYQIARPEAVLSASCVRILFMVRRPGPALSSIVGKLEYIQGPKQAYEHYVEQVDWVRTIAEYVPADRWTYTSYSRLTQNTDQELSRLESFLELSVPLSERYETNRYTGVSGIGDPGDHIKTGYIKRDIDREIDLRIRPYLSRSKEKFEDCLHTLREESSQNQGSPA